MQSNNLTIPDHLINYNVELAVIKYLVRHPTKISDYNVEYFLSKDSVRCYSELHKLINVGSVENLDINDFAKIVSGNHKGILDESTLILAFKQSSDITPENESIYKDTLVNNYFKQKAQKSVFENIEVLVKSKGSLNPDELEKEADKLKEIANQIRGKKEEVKLYTTTDLYNIHCETIDRRKAGIAQRTFGFTELDQFLSRPAAAGEISTFAAMTGVGKSLLLKNLEYKLMKMNYLQYQPCILSLNFEMGIESNMDRYLSMHTKHSMKDLQSKKTLELISKDVKKSLRSFTNYKNYLYLGESISDLKTLDTKVIPAARKYFTEMGLLPPDGYMIITFDALTHLDNFMEVDVAGYESAMKLQDILVKNHNAHGINVCQLNENKFRQGFKFKHHSEVDSYVFGLEDIFGSSAISKYSRSVWTMNRPKVLKERCFSSTQAEWVDEFGYDGKGDIANINLVKANDGQLGMAKFVVLPNLLFVPLDERMRAG